MYNGDQTPSCCCPNQHQQQLKDLHLRMATSVKLIDAKFNELLLEKQEHVKQLEKALARLCIEKDGLIDQIKERDTTELNLRRQKDAALEQVKLFKAKGGVSWQRTSDWGWSQRTTKHAIQKNLNNAFSEIERLKRELQSQAQADSPKGKSIYDRMNEARNYFNNNQKTASAIVVELERDTDNPNIWESNMFNVTNSNNGTVSKWELSLENIDGQALLSYCYRSGRWRCLRAVCASVEIQIFGITLKDDFGVYQHGHSHYMQHPSLMTYDEFEKRSKGLETIDANVKISVYEIEEEE